jgi:malate/lactate dehydrogenase
MEINKIAVLGAGTMGMGIAWAVAGAGKKVVLYDIKQEIVDKTLARIGKGLAKAEEKGQAPAGAKDFVTGNITGTVNMQDLADVDFVIESVVENMDIKKQVYAELGKILKPEVIVATKYPYDVFEEGGYSLRGNAEEVAAELAHELQERLAVAGVEVLEARLTHLAYATEIASAMLQRQQASAILAARQKIVEGAVGMAQMAIAQLEENQTVDLDEERKVAMINNLLVAIVSDRSAQPVINTGTLY